MYFELIFLMLMGKVFHPVMALYITVCFERFALGLGVNSDMLIVWLYICLLFW